MMLMLSVGRKLLRMQHERWIHLLILVLVVAPCFLSSSVTTTKAEDGSVNLPVTPLPESPPSLAGQHFKITVVEEEGFITVQEKPNGQLSFSGYLMDILEELAWRANFTYELRTPSGFGSLCVPRLVDNTTLPAYHSRFRQDYNCGESDVNDRPLSPNHSTDMYWGAYYITPERLQVNKFTIPYSPPESASLGMMGTATHIHSIHDLQNTKHKVCALAGTAYMKLLQISFPHLQIHGIKQDESIHRVLDEGTCDVIIESIPMLRRYVLDFYLQDKCLVNYGKPVGIIGEPLEYGLNYFAFGIRMDLDDKIVQTLNFWLQALMSCFPEDKNGFCYGGEGSISQMYSNSGRGHGGGGRGDECGYVQFPPLLNNVNKTEDRLSPGAIAAIALTPVVLVLALGMIYHIHQLKAQERRMKRRFVQQLARNIDIGPSPGDLSAAKLSETFEHIGGTDGNISKTDLATWMNDINLDFLSDNDFDRLWNALDLDKNGRVDPIDFFAFLKDCEDQFEQVHEEYSSLPRSEKVKLAARRLTNIRNMGFEEVRKMERRNNKRTRQAIVYQNVPSGRNLMSSSTTHSPFDESSCTNKTSTTAASSADGSSQLGRRFRLRHRLSRSMPPSSGMDQSGEEISHFRISETAFQVASSITSEAGGFQQISKILQNEMSKNGTVNPRSSTTSVLHDIDSEADSGAGSVSIDEEGGGDADDIDGDILDPSSSSSSEPPQAKNHHHQQEDAVKVPRSPKPGRFKDLEKNYKEEITGQIESLDKELLKVPQIFQK